MPTRRSAIPTRTQRLAELFEAAIDIADSTARERYLDEHCTADAALREEVERLLRHDAREGDTFLRSPVAAADEQAHAQLRAGDVIGRRYTLVRQLGAGGMGVVWLARQDHPAREVALKMLRPGVASRQALRRFEFEAMVLARLQHPGIAQVYDAGMHDDGWGGQPYFVMEYVAGPRLNEFVTTANLDRPQRLALVARICDALHHAHQKGVIHRDLKPGNILVISGDDGPQPKILDFGVARALEPDEQFATLHTSHGQLVGTLPYMSPEQVAGDPDHIDARSDVYSLGVILYGLVTGRLPFDFSKMTVAMAAKTIVESEPAAPSLVDRSLRGDLNTIILKALEKNIERRYASTAALGADIRHFLAREPIEARPTSRVYHMRQFARRNKALVAGLSAAILALCAGIVVSTAAMLRAQDHADQARREAERAGAINSFLGQVLIAGDTGESGDVRLVDLLEEASDRVDAEFAVHSDLAVDVHDLLAAAFFSIGRYDQAEYHARRQLAITEALWGKGHALTRPPRGQIAGVLLKQSRFDDAEEMFRGLVEGPEAALRDSTWFAAQRSRATILRFRNSFAEATALLRSTLEEAQRTVPEPDRVSARLLYELANTIADDARFGDHSAQRARLLREEAKTLLQQVIEHPGTDGFSYACSVRLNLARLAMADEDVEEALVLATEGRDMAEGQVGADHPDVADAEIVLAMALMSLGRFEEAASRAIHAVEVHRANDESSPTTLAAMSEALPILDSAEGWATALNYASVLGQRSPGHGSHRVAHPVVYRVWQGYLYARLNDPDSAAPILDEVRARETEMSDRDRSGLYYALGLCALAQNDRPAARAHLEHARDLRLQSAPGPWPDAQKIQEEIDRLDR